MKQLLLKSLLVAGISLFASVSIAQNGYNGNGINANGNNNRNNKTHKNLKWFCETNASSSSNEADKKADEMMDTQSKKASMAFDYAYKHCRDCTKITCTVDKE